MRIFFASGDVGGARALAPVVKLAAEQGHKITVLSHGAICNELPDVAPYWTTARDGESIEDHLSRIAPEWLVFGTSVSDPVALKYAIAAERQNCPTAMLLDSWSSYRARLISEDGKTHWPDIYAVMDQLAYEKALASGIKSEILRITGSPALSDIKPYHARQTASGNAPLDIIFVNEPVGKDQGDNPNQPGYRGYVEQDVLSMLCQALQKYSKAVRLWVFPHPRDDWSEVEALWQRLRGNLDGGLVAEPDKKACLARAHRVTGMASILLYKAWLQGYPVLSLQPRLRLDSLRFLEGRPGMSLVDSIDDFADKLDLFFNQSPSSEHGLAAEVERTKHLNAAPNFLSILNSPLPKSVHKVKH